jgi:hypothetical protein
VSGESDCIIAEIDRLVATLRDRSKPEEERAFALKLLVHFVADLHCPLHASDNADRGGNHVRVEFFGRPTNLHSVWDSRLIQQAGYTVTSLTEELEKSGLSVTAAGTPVAWAEEAHDVARDVAYRIPPDHVLGQAYLDAAMPALKLQLLRGGVRLAGLLNAIVDGGATIGPSLAASTPPTALSAASARATASGAGPYHGNIRSKVYHAPGCPNYDCTNCTAVFATTAEAEKAGYRAHAACVRR